MHSQPHFYKQKTEAQRCCLSCPGSYTIRTSEPQYFAKQHTASWSIIEYFFLMKLDFGISYKYTVYYHHITMYFSYMPISWKILKAELSLLLLSSLSLVFCPQTSYCHGLSEIQRVKSILKRITRKTQKVKRSVELRKLQEPLQNGTLTHSLS